MKKNVPIRDFVEELLARIEAHKDIDCCAEQIKVFAEFVVEKMGDEEIEIDWTD